MSHTQNLLRRWVIIGLAATLGMALAVAGTATAATKIGQNQLKRNAVGSKQL